MEIGFLFMTSIHDTVAIICRRYALLTLAALPIAIFAGCGKPTSSPQPPQGAMDESVVATVNDVPIGRDQMYTEMEQFVPAQLEDFPRNPYLAVPAGRFALQHLITNELAVQLAQSQQVTVTDQQVTDRYNDVKMVQNALKTKDFDDVLTDQGMTVQQYKDISVKPDVAQFNVLTKGMKPNNQELLDSYNAHIADYTEPARVHLERIVLDDEATAQQAYQTASKTNSLDDVLSLNRSQPLSGGADDADIAQWIPVNSDPALAPVMSMAETAQPGTVLKPVQVAGRWWLVKLVDRKDKEVLSYTEVKHIVFWNLMMNKANAAGNVQKVQSLMQELTQSAVINVRAPQYASLVKQLKSPSYSSTARITSSQPSN
jgi:parvulin-like peptidyl-prolyl isomerase